MKILVTGITKLHAVPDHYLKQQLKVIPSEPALVLALRELGHTVDHKAVSWGEDLDQYDKVITYLSGTDSFVCDYTDGALWTLKREDTLIAIDDWQTTRTFMDAFKTEGKWKPAFSAAMNGQEAHREEIDELHSKWLFGRKVLAPAFTGGDTDLMFKKAYAQAEKKGLDFGEKPSVFAYDPNPLLPLRQGKFKAPDKKEMKWIIAGLNEANRKWWKKIGATLPVIEVGKKGKEGIRLPENQMVNFCGGQFLHLMPKYDHAGSGWWRARPQQIVDVESVLYCDPEEAKIFGDSWVIDNPLSLETMSPAELHDLALRMKADFYKNHPTDAVGKARSISQVENFLNG